MASRAFNDPVTLVEILVPGDEINGLEGQTARNIAEKYVQMSGNFPQLIRNLKKGEQTETDLGVTQAMVFVRMRAENLLDNIAGDL